MSRYNRYISDAWNVAENSKMLFQLGAIVVIKGTIVARGWNDYIQVGKMSEHAEMHALRNLEKLVQHKKACFEGVQRDAICC
jgi:tRNA(Arg) A34 adenosine deaminase TadA